MLGSWILASLPGARDSGNSTPSTSWAEAGSIPALKQEQSMAKLKIHAKIDRFFMKVPPSYLKDVFLQL